MQRPIDTVTDGPVFSNEPDVGMSLIVNPSVSSYFIQGFEMLCNQRTLVDRLNVRADCARILCILLSIDQSVTLNFLE